MRLLSCSIFLLAIEATAAPSVMVMPFGSKDGLIGEAGHAIQLRAVGVVATGGVNEIHPKQINRVLEHHARRLAPLPEDQRTTEVATVLGADFVVTGTLERGANDVGIAFQVRSLDGKKSANGRVKGATLMAALEPFSSELAAVLAKVGAFAGAPAGVVTPVTSNEEALLEYAGCHRILIEQPIGIQTPTLLDVRRIDSAIRQCKEALKNDPAFADAKAALGFLYALAEDQKQAEKHLAMVKDEKAFLPMYWIGKFWVVSRYHDIDAAIRTLEAGIDTHPGFLLARGYLGDSLVALARYEAALAAFQKYLELTPNQPWVMGRIGYVSSKLGKVDEAIAWTNKGLRISPSDSELLLEMASRHVDGKKLDDAITILQRLVAEGHARGEVHLRLGYAYLQKGRLPDAERELHMAITDSTQLSEWRTRGRARYDLAKMWMQTGVPGNALRQLRMAVEEGYRDRAVFESDPDFMRVKGDPEFQAILKAQPRQKNDLPKYASPFRIDPESGNIDLSKAGKSKQPQGTVILKF
jgi:tetratricopeptide (TPR) repeat protein